MKKSPNLPLICLIFIMFLIPFGASATCTSTLREMRRTMVNSVDQIIARNPRWNKTIAADCKDWLLNGGRGKSCQRETTEWKGIKSVLASMRSRLNTACNSCVCPTQGKMIDLMWAGGADLIIRNIEELGRQRGDFIFPKHTMPATYEPPFESPHETAI